MVAIYPCQQPLQSSIEYLARNVFTEKVAAVNVRLRLVAILRRRFRNTWVQRVPGVSSLYRLMFRGVRRHGSATVDFRGVELVLPTDDITMVPSLVQGDYERFELDLFSALLEPGDVVFDVGANIGVYSLVACKVEPSAHVYAFEPIPANLEMFRENLTRFASASVTIVSQAVGATSGGTVRIGVERSNIGTHSIGAAGGVATIDVPMVSLDGFAESEGVVPTIIKIDVEGYEPAVLAGASALLANKPTLMVEFTPRLMKACGFEPADCAALLLETYQRIHLIDERQGRLRELTNAQELIDAVGKATSVNVVCVSDEHRHKLDPFV